MPLYLLNINSYLRDRKLVIITKDGKIVVNLSACVPQRSIKGPLLWIWMYNGLLRSKIPREATIVGFAGDLAFLVVVETAELVKPWS